jgi:hypothetical protein
MNILAGLLFGLVIIIMGLWFFGYMDDKMNGR